MIGDCHQWQKETTQGHSEEGKYAPLMELDCRGYDPVEFPNLYLAVVGRLNLFDGEIVFDQKHKLYDPKSNQTNSNFDKRVVVRGFSYSPSMTALEGMKPSQT